MELGKRIGAFETAHRALLRQFFDDKRAEVDRYIDQVWLPTYAEQVLKEPTIATLWGQVCQGGTDRDKLEFLRRVGPKVQRRVNDQRTSMIEQLDELERTIADHLTAEYDQARSINNTLTSFLTSASKVEENRKRYLEMLGVHDAAVESALSAVETVVGDLSHDLDVASEGAKKADAFKAKLNDTLTKAKAAFEAK
jgi:hypothetical protein